MKIHFEKIDSHLWDVYNMATGIGATINKIEEHGFLSRDTPTRYRVDVNGYTVSSMIENFQTAKGIAYKHVRG